MSVRGETIRRLQSELRSFFREDGEFRPFTVRMLEDNALEWHFTMLGPCTDESNLFDTTNCETEPYRGGIYHGRIVFPNDYPFKPPDVLLLTPNGRFETNKKLCLSVTSYHPETWEPTFGVATVLTALRVFMLTCGNSAIGAMEVSFTVRRNLAINSKSFVCTTCGTSCGEEWETLHRRWIAAKEKPEAVATPLSPPVVRDETLQSSAPGTHREAEPQGDNNLSPLVLPAPAPAPPPNEVPAERSPRNVLPAPPQPEIVPDQPQPRAPPQHRVDPPRGTFTLQINKWQLDFVTNFALSVLLAVFVRKMLAMVLF